MNPLTYVVLHVGPIVAIGGYFSGVFQSGVWTTVGTLAAIVAALVLDFLTSRRQPPIPEEEVAAALRAYGLDQPSNGKR